jgi:hypothetical protein
MLFDPETTRKAAKQEDAAREAWQILGRVYPGWRIPNPQPKKVKLEAKEILDGSPRLR